MLEPRVSGLFGRATSSDDLGVVRAEYVGEGASIGERGAGGRSEGVEFREG